MKKKQISLKQISVKSFVTNATKKSNALRGGTGGCNTADDPFFCTQYGKTDDPVSGPGPTATNANTCGVSASCPPTCSPINTLCCVDDDYTRDC